MGSNGFEWALAVFSSSIGVLLGFSGFISLDITGINQVLLGCTQF